MLTDALVNLKTSTFEWYKYFTHDHISEIIYVNGKIRRSGLLRKFLPNKSIKCVLPISIARMFMSIDFRDTELFREQLIKDLR